MSGVSLRTQGLHKSFGALHVTQGIDFALPQGARQALIGPNGAGKTTLLNLITGVEQPSAGRILLDERDITGLSEAQRSRAGLARTFQINQLFRALSVFDNVRLAVAERLGIGGSLLIPLGRRADVTDETLALLEKLQLVPDALKLIRELPYGRQRLVEIAIALAQQPRVLLLDEPAAGLPTSEHQLILDVIASLDARIAVLMIDHDMDLVFRVAERITVLVAGAILTEGTPAEISADSRVRTAYLGADLDA